MKDIGTKSCQHPSKNTFEQEQTEAEAQRGDDMDILKVSMIVTADKMIV